MNESKLNLVVPKDYNGTPIEVVLREGKAAEPLPIREPLSVEITGTIDAPLRWLEKKISLIDQKQAHIQVDRDNMSITLIDRETDYYTNTITGQLSPSKEMTDFGINHPSKLWEPARLAQFCKMHRAFFRDKTANMALVSDLKNFKANVTQGIERSKEENGSRTDNFSQVVDSNLPKSFKMSIPLFKGFAQEEIEVEIYAEVDGRNVGLMLVSAGANETIEECKNRMIDEQVKAIREVAPDIAIIEV